jgi:hypothetical protein
VYVTLTDDGREAARNALQEALRIFAELGRGLDHAAQTAITGACGALRERIQDVLEAPGFPNPPSP